MAFPRIAVILINYRTPQMTLDCLASLEPEVDAHPGMHVVVIDSASGDDSAHILDRERVARNWTNWMSLVCLDENRGFSAGNNAGIAFAAALGQFHAFLLINSDTVVRLGAIDVLGRVLDDDPSVGLVGPRLEWPDGQLQVSCFRRISPGSEFLTAAKTGPISRLFPRQEVAIQNPPDRDGTATGIHLDEIDWISFACVLIRKEVRAAVGPMDEGFFMYFEDVDYCRRARAAGWKLAYASEAHVVHLRGGRTPDLFAAEERRRRPAYYYKARARYLARYYGLTGPWRANVCWLLGRGISLAREVVGNKPPHTARCEAADIWTGSLCGFESSIRQKEIDQRL